MRLTIKLILVSKSTFLINMSHYVVLSSRIEGIDRKGTRDRWRGKLCQVTNGNGALLCVLDMF